MSFSAKAEYACLAMLDLAVMSKLERPIQQRKMAERHGIPPQFLVQILQQLRTAGLVHSTRGAAGGYQLARPPEEISLWDVVAAVQGDTERGPFEQRDSSAADVLRGVWCQVADSQLGILRQARLADLASQVDLEDEPMYFI